MIADGTYENMARTQVNLLRNIEELARTSRLAVDQINEHRNLPQIEVLNINGAQD